MILKLQFQPCQVGELLILTSKLNQPSKQRRAGRRFEPNFLNWKQPDPPNVNVNVPSAPAQAGPPPPKR